MCALWYRYEIPVTNGVAGSPVKVGSGVTNAQGVFLMSGQWAAGNHSIAVDWAPNFNVRSPVPVGWSHHEPCCAQCACVRMCIVWGLLVGVCLCACSMAAGLYGLYVCSSASRRAV